LPFSDANRSLRDIADAIGMIETFTAGMDFEAFQSNPMAVAAVERKLQVISEAAMRLGTDAELLFLGPPWRNIRGIGNWLRHQYDRIELPMIWKTVRTICHRSRRRLARHWRQRVDRARGHRGKRYRLRDNVGNAVNRQAVSDR
jgi:uncharacterized protein with HEPN domain